MTGCGTSSLRSDDPVATKLAEAGEIAARSIAHEVGHAFSALLHPECNTLQSLEITRKGGAVTGGANYVDAHVENATTRSGIVACLSFYFAGQVSDRLINGGTPLPNGDDRIVPEDVAREMLGDDRIPEALAAAEKLAESELSQHRAELAHIALDLYYSESLTADEVVASLTNIKG
jgi:hypothetical protein